MNKNVNNTERSAKAIQLKRRLKYGGISVALSAVVIAAVIIGNFIFTSFISKNNLYPDLTNSGLYTLSDEAKEYLSEIKVPITIKFAVPLDTINSDPYFSMVYSTALEFSKASKEDDKDDLIPDIEVEYLDSLKNPAQFEKYKQLTEKWLSSNVVVECRYENGEEESDAALPIVCSFESFFSKSDSDSTIVGYNGERRFLIAFLQLAGIEQPTVVFTTGHGEPIGESPTDDANQYAGFMNMLYDYGFKIKYKDLSREDIDDPDGKCRLLVILDPQRDFLSGDESSLGGISELDKVSDYVNDQGTLMVFLGPTGQDYMNLSHYLAEWGVKVYTKYTIEDSVNALTDKKSFTVVYTTDGYAASAQKNYRNLRTFFRYAAPVEILFTNNDKIESVTSSFITSSSAEAYSSDTDVLHPADLGNASGFNLFTIAIRQKYQNNVRYPSYVLVSGCPEMLKYCGSQAYANRGVMSVLVAKIPLEKVLVDIDYKSFEDYGVPDITAGAVRFWTVILTVVMPIATLAAGVVVVVIRKRR